MCVEIELFGPLVRVKSDYLPCSPPANTLLTHAVATADKHVVIVYTMTYTYIYIMLIRVSRKFGNPRLARFVYHGIVMRRGVYAVTYAILNNIIIFYPRRSVIVLLSLYIL